MRSQAVDALPQACALASIGSSVPAGNGQRLAQVLLGEGARAVKQAGDQLGRDPNQPAFSRADLRAEQSCLGEPV